VVVFGAAPASSRRAGAPFGSSRSATGTIRPPGFVEVDFVADAGTSASSNFVQTLVLTDIATGWTECVPVVVRNSAFVIEALAAAIRLFPFPLRGVDFDNDGLFMNEPVVAWCGAQQLEVTRSRAYRKKIRPGWNRRTGRSCGAWSVYRRETLARLYAAARLHTNLFQPSFKLKEKTRIGARSLFKAEVIDRRAPWRSFEAVEFATLE
jgi:hypothetical protein